MSITAATKTLSKKEKDAFLKELLGKDYVTSGNNLPLLNKLIDYIGTVDTTLSLAELIPIANGILRSSTILSTVASGATVVSIFMFPISSMLNIINAYQTEHKMYAFRAIAYTFTSWVITNQ